MVNHMWQIQEAKSRLSALIADAQSSGPQTITRHGSPIAVVVSRADFERLTGKSQRSIAEFFADSPLAEITIGDRNPSDVSREIAF